MDTFMILVLIIACVVLVFVCDRLVKRVNNLEYRLEILLKQVLNDNMQLGRLMGYEYGPCGWTLKRVPKADVPPVKRTKKK